MGHTPTSVFRFKLFRQERFQVCDTAEVVAETTDLSIMNSDQVMERISNAVAKWIENTEEGKSAWDNSGEDFNIADLIDYCEEPSLSLELLKEGITRLDIHLEDEVQGSPENFNFDSILPMRAPKGFNNPNDI